MELQHILKLTIRCIGSGALQEVQTKVMYHLGTPGMSYRVIFSWVLLVLGLPRRGQGEAKV